MKVQEGPPGFTFLKGDKYIFKYSFKAKDGMKVSKRFTHLGQLKGSRGGYMVEGDPIYSLTANNDGLMVRFSNKESIEDYEEGMDTHLDWEDATGEWVHVEIVTVFGESMEVRTLLERSSEESSVGISSPPDVTAQPPLPSQMPSGSPSLPVEQSPLVHVVCIGHTFQYP